MENHCWPSSSVIEGPKAAFCSVWTSTWRRDFRTRCSSCTPRGGASALTEWTTRRKAGREGWTNTFWNSCFQRSRREVDLFSVWQTIRKSDRTIGGSGRMAARLDLDRFRVPRYRAQFEWLIEDAITNEEGQDEPDHRKGSHHEEPIAERLDHEMDRGGAVRER